MKREKEEQQRATAAAHKLKLTEFAKKQDVDEANAAFLASKLMAMKGRMVGKAWSSKAAEKKEMQKIKVEKPKEKISTTLRKARGPYKEDDPLHMCHINHNCHRRNQNSKRCGLHEMDEAEAKKKQKVSSILISIFLDMK